MSEESDLQRKYNALEFKYNKLEKDFETFKREFQVLINKHNLLVKEYKEADLFLKRNLEQQIHNVSKKIK